MRDCEPHAHDFSLGFLASAFKIKGIPAVGIVIVGLLHGLSPGYPTTQP